MHQHQRAVSRQRWLRGQNTELGCRPGIGFDAVYAADMHQHAPCICGTQPGNINAERLIAGPACSYWQAEGGGIAALCRFAKARTRRRVT